MDLAKESLELKRKVIENYIEKDFTLIPAIIYLILKKLVANITAIIFPLLV